MLLMRKSLLIVSSVLAVAATGVMSAGPASATESSGSTSMCVYNSAAGEYGEFDCAWANGAGQPVGMYPITGNTTTWYVPVSGWGEIRQAGTNLCMQLNNSANNRIQEATCTGASYQKFSRHYFSQNTYVYNSEWGPYLCLTYNENNQILDMVTCPYHNGVFAPGYAPWYQQVVS